MPEIKVSVIIPVYNTEAYVADTLESIMHQTLRDIEIIVINDGSTDNSRAVVKAVAGNDSRVIFYDQENRGVSEARNLGIRVAKGEFIYFMDSDDLLADNTLLECYDRCKIENVDFVFFDADIFGQSVKSLHLNYHRTHLIEDGIYSGLSILEHFGAVGGFQASPCLSFINLSYLKKIRLTFYPRILHEDELFTFLLYVDAERVACLPKAFFKRRLRDNSIMVNHFSSRNLEGYLTVISELLRLRRSRKDDKVKMIVDKRLAEILRGVVYNSRGMKVRNRLSLLYKCLFFYNNYVSTKDLIILSFPLLSSLKRRIVRETLSNA